MSRSQRPTHPHAGKPHPYTPESHGVKRTRIDVGPIAASRPPNFLRPPIPSISSNRGRHAANDDRPTETQSAVPTTVSRTGPHTFGQYFPCSEESLAGTKQCARLRCCSRFDQGCLPREVVAKLRYTEPGIFQLPIVRH